MNKILGQDLVEVIGTFVDGVLHGNAKLVLANRWVVQASFASGLAEGLQRVWDARGNLVPVKNKPFSFVIHTCSK